ncbi:hypothetical protein GO755_30425 [Spirosoma sp. HMF4905]|uniref:Uncharacterized protein n=1 Tax=Spirosoma arboris TaxID=2682092 RepID=A0A7K1SKQ4_9BACT|nr:hypothetical protein [Spirosoma arboris]MVM34387.1 hypothetical protein [Spirosoma arboris]
MFDETLISLLAQVDKYFAETPKDVIDKELKAIDAMQFSGPSAKEYFASFHSQFQASPAQSEYIKFEPEPTAFILGTASFLLDTCRATTGMHPWLKRGSAKRKEKAVLALSPMADLPAVGIETYNTLHVDSMGIFGALSAEGDVYTNRLKDLSHVR